DVDINKTNARGRTPLHLSVMLEDVKITNELLKHPIISVNAQDNDGLTALMHAAQRIRLETTKGPSEISRPTNQYQGP
ncbi:hypothetical protein EJ04DRAFT_436190, partial [Polyplosphaeria fusca]